MFKIVELLNSTTAKLLKAVRNRYLSSKLDGKRNLLDQVKNMTKQVDNFQHFETDQKVSFYKNISLRIKESNISPRGLSETDLRDKKLD